MTQNLTELDRELEAARVVAQIHRDVRVRLERRRQGRRDMLFLALTFFAFALMLMGATWLPW